MDVDGTLEILDNKCSIVAYNCCVCMVVYFCSSLFFVVGFEGANYLGAVYRCDRVAVVLGSFVLLSV
jgi:cellobiose-specific phosphotransferase system component IIC